MLGKFSECIFHTLNHFVVEPLPRKESYHFSEKFWNPILSQKDQLVTLVK